MQPSHYLKFDNQEHKIEEILTDLGYELNDRGSYWQCKALYRDGDNQTALQIWKNTGIWKDFVAGTSYLPFKKLLELSCEDKRQLRDIYTNFKSDEEPSLTRTSIEKLEMQQFFDHEEVKTLLPHYIFYNKKGISDNVLKEYRSGLSMSGKMNGRYVFPIYDFSGRIIGLSGRHLLWNESSNLSKWKHLGRKSNWVYPIHMNKKDNLFTQDIENKKEIILIESIGDSLALTEQNYRNHMVVFGLKLSSKQLSYLVSLNLNKIIIATNNDWNKSDNTGLQAAIKMFLKIIKYFDISMVDIKLPGTQKQSFKDFGEMFESDIPIKNWADKRIDKKKQIELILNYLYNNNKSSKQINVLENYLKDFNFEANSIS